MSKRREIDEILTKEETQNCNNYDEYLKDLLERVKDKTVGGVKWDEETIKEVYEVATTYTVLQYTVDHLKQQHVDLVKAANAKVAQYNKAKNKEAARNYLNDYNRILAKIKNVKAELNHYEALRLNYEDRALNYDKKLDTVREYLAENQKEKTASQPR